MSVIGTCSKPLDAGLRLSRAFKMKGAETLDAHTSVEQGFRLNRGVCLRGAPPFTIVMLKTDIKGRFF